MSFGLIFGGMAERSNAAVLKTVRLPWSLLGSNPSPSAKNLHLANFSLVTIAHTIAKFVF